MALKTLVKVSEVNNLSDARYCAGMGVDLIGFPVNTSHPNYVSPENYKAITGWIEGVKLVVEFNNSTAKDIQEAMTSYEAHFIQVNTPEIISELGTELPIILKVELKNDLSVYRNLFKEYQSSVSHFLIESDKEEELTDKSFNELKHLSSTYPIIVGFGINSNNLEQILTNIAPIGLALKGGTEIRPGYKNFDELADILEELELD